MILPNAPNVSRATRTVGGGIVERGFVKNEDELLQFAESWAGGNLSKWRELKSFGSNSRYISKNGKWKIELELRGHKTTNEGPHVTIEKIRSDGGWDTFDKVFIENWEHWAPFSR